VSASGVQRASEHPGKLRRFHDGSGALVQVGTVTIGRAVLKPGWHWSTSQKGDARLMSSGASRCHSHGSPPPRRLMREP
jgi:hypothetical protein